MPESAAKSAQRKARVREAERRRQAVNTLRIAEAMCGYGAEQLANGLAPAEARGACVELAGELSDVATALRRAAMLRPAQRRALARCSPRARHDHAADRDRLGVSDVSGAEVPGGGADGPASH